MKNVIRSAMGILLVIACMVVTSGCGGDVTIDPQQAGAGGTGSGTGGTGSGAGSTGSGAGGTGSGTPPPIAPTPPLSTQLFWDAPTTNPDGSPLNGTLAGYKVYYGTSSGSYSTVIDAGNVTSYDVSGLAAGTYYFVVTAYDTFGSESPFSNEVMRTN